MILFIFLLILFFYLAGRHERRRNKKNPYITRHEKKIAHNTNYVQYEKWCLEKGEIPANKESFIKDEEQKEAFIKDLLRLVSTHILFRDGRYYLPLPSF